MKNGKRLRFILLIIISFLSLFYFGYLFVWQSFGNVHPDIWKIIKEHYAVFIGLPCAAITSFLLVLILEQVHGEIEFSALGMNFKGGSGPIVFWVLCYLTIIISIKILW